MKFLSFFKRFCFFSCLATLLYLSGFAIIHSLQGHRVFWYDRFTKQTDSTKSFNWWAVLSPIQVESRAAEDDSATFDQKVIYPVARGNFQLVAPTTTAGEDSVATLIAHVIADSIEQVAVTHFLEYDQTSHAVWRARTAPLDSLAPSSVLLHMTGTASPEAKKYGLRESLQPGHIERENLVLARERLDRTATLIKKKLRGVSVQMGDVQAIEVQLNADDIERVLAHPALLDSLRYVRAFGAIAIHRQRIVTATAPILFPLLLLILSIAIGELVGELLFYFLAPAGLRGKSVFTRIFSRKRYWYFSYDHFYPEKVSASVIASHTRRFPAYEAHEKIKSLMRIEQGRSSLHMEIHHHFRISKHDYEMLLLEEGRRI